MEHELLLKLGDATSNGTVIVLVTWLICRLIPRLAGSARCWLWWIVCAKILLGLIALPALSFAVLPDQEMHLGMQYSGGNSSVTDTESHENMFDVNQSFDSSSTSGNTYKSLPISASQVFLIFWLIGIGIGIGAQSMSLIHLRRLTIGATRQDLPLLVQAARQVGLRTSPTLWVSPALVEPLTIGGIRPAIVLSEKDLARLSDTELLPILTHECVHIRRNDLLFSLVPTLTRILFWFLPPVYLASHEFELAREAACDQETIAVLTLAPRTYGELLVKLSSPVTPLPTPSSVMALSAGFRYLKRRIEMLEIKPRRRQLLTALLLLAPALLPWRLTAAASLFPLVSLPNLDFASGMKSWRRTAMGSDTMEHPFYSLGVDPAVTYEGKRAGYVKAKDNIAKDQPGDGGVLRYDLDGEKFRGKRLRWSGYIKGRNLKQKAFLFFGAQGENMLFVPSKAITPESNGWVKRECIVDVPSDAVVLFLGLRLEGGGIAYGSGFKLEVVDKTIPLTDTATQIRQGTIRKEIPAPTNLTFTNGLENWWNDNPTHTASVDYTIDVSKSEGRDGNPAASLKSKVKAPRSYGTLAQNASPRDYLGKRIRLSASLKSQNAKEGDLWIVVHDKDSDKTRGANGLSTRDIIQGTQDWTRFERIVDVPDTTQVLSFGISSEGTGTILVDGFKIEVVGPAGK